MSELASQFDGDVVASAVTVDEFGVVVLGPLDLQTYDRYTLYVQNTGANNLTQVDLEVGPESTGPWVISETMAVPPAAGNSGALAAADKAHKYVRFKMFTGAGTTTTVDVWLSVGADL